MVHKEFTLKKFRVTIFGSSRIKKNNPNYKQVKNLAHMLGEKGIGIITGGGPGIMKAANEGHDAGEKNSPHKSTSIGLLIKLPNEQHPNKYLDVEKEFNRFSSRLDHFMSLTNVFVIAEGGIGTCLELMYALQLIQVKHTCNVPIILMGDMWPDFIKWLEKWPLKKGLIDKIDLEVLFLAKDSNEAMRMINQAYLEYKKGHKNFCLNYDKYKLY